MSADLDLDLYGIQAPPGADDLITDDGEPMESSRHRDQMVLLIELLRRHLAGRDDVYVSGNNFLYFSETQTRKNDFRGPDVYVALGVVQRERKAWVLWEEDGHAPDLIVELTSDSTREADHQVKKRIYGQLLRVPWYVIFDPWSAELEVFALEFSPTRYRPVRPNDAGRYPCSECALEFGLWQGSYGGVEATWLRIYTPDGQLVPTDHELAEQEAKRARQEAKRARQEAKRARQAELTLEQVNRRLREYERQFGALPTPENEERGTRNEERGTRDEEGGMRNEADPPVPKGAGAEAGTHHPATSSPDPHPVGGG